MVSNPRTKFFSCGRRAHAHCTFRSIKSVIHLGDDVMDPLVVQHLTPMFVAPVHWWPSHEVTNPFITYGISVLPNREL